MLLFNVFCIICPLISRLGQELSKNVYYSWSDLDILTRYGTVQDHAIYLQPNRYGLILNKNLNKWHSWAPGQYFCQKIIFHYQLNLGHFRMLGCSLEEILQHCQFRDKDVNFYWYMQPFCAPGCALAEDKLLVSEQWLIDLPDIVKMNLMSFRWKQSNLHEAVMIKSLCRQSGNPNPRGILPSTRSSNMQPHSFAFPFWKASE